MTAASRRRVDAPALRLEAVGAVLLLASSAGWWIDRPTFFAAWLSAWWFCLGVVLGATANGWIHTITGGGWGELLWPVILRLQRRLPWLLLLFLPLLAGLPVIFPWSAAPAQWLASMDHPAFQQAWFAPGFLGLRLVVYALAFGLMARAGRVATSGRAAIGLLAYMLLGSLATVDLLMSLVAGWTSSVFGWLALVGQMATGAAAAVALAAFAQRGRPTLRAAGAVPVWRDLGNLLLMYVLIEAYLQFMQFLIVWAENLPREISWFVPRLQTGWWWVSLSLVVLQFALPLLALLWRSNKDRPGRLAWIAAGLLLMQAVETAWLVLPSVQPSGYGGWWLLPLVFAGMGLLLFGGLLAPVRVEAPPAWREEPAHG